MSETVVESVLSDPLEDFFGYQLRRASAAAMAHLANALAPEKISPAVATVLLMIEANPDQTQARIGRELSIQRANIAPMILRLEEDGLIRRNSPDGRSFGLVCTQRGKAKAARVKKIMEEHEARMFDHIDSVTRARLTAALKIVRSREEA